MRYGLLFCCLLVCMSVFHEHVRRDVFTVNFFCVVLCRMRMTLPAILCIARVVGRQSVLRGIHASATCFPAFIHITRPVVCPARLWLSSCTGIQLSIELKSHREEAG